MLKKAKSLGIEMSMLSEKIKRRIRELENSASEDTVIIYRDDFIIKEAVKRLRDLRYLGREICACYHLPENMHSQFKDEPKIIRQLDLTESLARTRLYLKRAYFVKQTKTSVMRACKGSCSGNVQNSYRIEFPFQPCTYGGEYCA